MQKIVLQTRKAIELPLASEREQELKILYNELQNEKNKKAMFRLQLLLSLTGNFMLALFAITLITTHPVMATSTKLSWCLVVSAVFGLPALWLHIRTFRRWQ